MNTRRSIVAITSFFLCLAPNLAWAGRIQEVAQTSVLERTIRFFSFADPSLRYALLGSVLLGLCCGLMGSFLLVRRLALMGDTLSHAVLPGVAAGFLWNMTKDPLAIFIGATIAGLLGAALFQSVRLTTRHHEDTALGFVLATFFGAGICLFTMIQNMPGGNKSGLDRFMFGQAAALSSGDVILLGFVAVAVLGCVLIFYKEYALTSFDPAFARTIGLPVKALHYLLILLLAFAIVSALQAVGVVLVSAMLVIPAASAYLLCDRLGVLLIVSAFFGVLSGLIGAFFSFVGKNLPTGPFMVVAAATLFLIAFFFAPRHGLLIRWMRHKQRTDRIRRENVLKSIYRLLEEENFKTEQVLLSDLAQQRKETLEQIAQYGKELVRFHFAIFSSRGDALLLTPEGWQRACEIVRNHRLWELYLTHAAQMDSDKVHEDAEEIEHILGEETVRKLEKRLSHARRDPHGKLIPGREDIQLRGPMDHLPSKQVMEGRRL